MDNPNLNNQVPVNTNPSIPKSNSHYLVPFVIALLLFFLLGFLTGLLIGRTRSQKPLLETESPQTNFQTPTLAPTVTPAEADTSGWKTYENKALKISFKYPANLTLKMTKGSEIVLNHNVPYENSGDCDMAGSSRKFPTLDDFNISITVSSVRGNPANLTPFAIGDLVGNSAIEGAEGCGDIAYYFSTPDGRFLTVRRARIQALSGISTAFDLEKLRNIPGIITKEENEKIFNQILSSLIFLP